LDGGVDPDIPDAGELESTTQRAIPFITGPVMVNIVGFTKDDSDPEAFVSASVSSAHFPNRSDVFIINDNAISRREFQSPENYANQIQSTLAQNTGDSYVASYAPWLIVPNPGSAGTITVPPGGAVAGVISRVDNTVGVFRAPAGMLASINNGLGVDTQFTDGQLGDLNARNINIIRPVPGVGLAIMGARTRKLFGSDRYVNARRTLIYLKESLKRSTAYALFENNDSRLWSQLVMTADRIVRPLWEAGGLAGTTASEAFFIKCDEELNTPQVVASGEVRMEIGVALQHPAEFIIIRVSQFERGAAAAEFDQSR